MTTLRTRWTAHVRPLLASWLSVLLLGRMAPGHLAIAADPPHLVKDSCPGSCDTFPQPLTVIGDTLYFVGYDPVNGLELWRSDGTTAGTTVATDIAPGAASSHPLELTAVGGTLFFNADDGVHGKELWKSDGSPGGTTMVKDIAPPSGSPVPPSSNPYGFVDWNGTAFFAASSTGTVDYELWRSNGTGPGTLMLKPFPIYTGEPHDLTVLNGALLFTADDGDGRELWKTDGTPAGTVMVKDIYPGNTCYPFDASPCDSDPGFLTTIPNLVLFSATSAGSGIELWKSDGTTAGTTMVREIAPGALDGNPYLLGRVGNRVFFVGNDGSTGSELWVSDGTTAGTNLVKDMSPGLCGSGPCWSSFSGSFFDLNGIAVFGASTVGGGAQMWRSDGTSAGTTPFVSPNTISEGSNAAVAVDGVLYFGGFDPAHGTELWRTDGTAAGTALVADISPGPAGSDPRYFRRVGNRLFFGADDGTHGDELFVYDIPCGDGHIDVGEQCDDGPFNGTDGCCTTSCAKVVGSTCIASRSTGTTCNPGTTCTLTTPDNSVSVTIFPGALTAPTNIGILGRNAGEYALGTGVQTLEVVDLLPNGQTFPLGTPAEIRFRWTDVTPPVDCLVDGTSNLYESSLLVYRNGLPITKVCGTRDATTGVCTAANFGSGQCTTVDCRFAGCNLDINTYVVDVIRFSEYAVAKACDPAGPGKLTVTKLDTPGGDDKLSFKGTFVRPQPPAAPLDPASHGLGVTLIDDTNVVVDVTLAGGAYDPVTRVGWKQNATSTKWTYVNKSAAPPGGIGKVVLKDRGTIEPGRLDITMKGVGGTYPVGPAVNLAVHLPETGECWAAAWPGPAPAAACVLNSSGKTLKCKPATVPTTTTETTTTTTSTMPTGLECGDATSPACDGACPEGYYCSTVGTFCSCGTIACGTFTGPPSCLGECPVGAACADDGNGGCVCAPAPQACGDASEPQCDGECPPRQYCADGCVCIDRGCGQVSGPPECAGECPPDAPLCVDVGGSCQCTTM